MRLETLNALLESCKTIRKLSPNTESSYTLRQGFSIMTMDNMLVLARAIDMMSIAINAVESEARIDLEPDLKLPIHGFVD